MPDAILMKPSGLTDEEFELVKRHPEDGARIVGRLRSLHATVPAILHHHERWDGTGYPHGLSGAEIPVEAGIVGLADAFDAMTTDRPYSDARPLEEAVEEIVRNRGTQFAPAAVDAFLRVAERMPETARDRRAAPGPRARVVSEPCPIRTSRSAYGRTSFSPGVIVAVARWFRLLDLPDALPRIAGVRARGDRPERVAGTNDVRPLAARPGRAVRRIAHGQSREANEDEKLPEHLFA